MRAVTSGLLFAVCAVPVGAGLVAGIALGTDAAAWRELLATPGIGRAVALSLWTGTAATLLSLVLAHALVAVAGTGAWLGRLRTGMLPLLALPHIAVAIGLALVLAPSGLLLRAASPWATGFALPPDWMTIQDPLGLALVLGLAAKETPFLVLMLLGALQQVPAQRLLLQARTLGYGPLAAWTYAVAPLLQRQIGLPIAAVLVFGITNVEMAIPLGPGAPPTLALLLWQWFTSGDLDRHPAIFAGALALLVATLAILAIAFAVGRLAHRSLSRLAGRGRRAVRDRGVRPLVLLAPLSILTLAGLGIVALALRGLSPLWRFPDLLPAHFDGGLFVRAAPQALAALATTAAVGALAAGAALAIAMLASESVADDPRARRRLDALLFAPLLVPQLAFLFGLQWLLVRLRWDGSVGAVVWSHAVLALPYVFGVVSGAQAALDPRLALVARTLGATRARAWAHVTVPLLARSLLLAYAIGFAVSSALYLPTVFAGAGRIVTVATEAASAAASGNYRIASVHATAMAAAPLLALLLATWAARTLYRNRRGVPA